LNEYIYKCFDCHKEFDSTEIESSLIYLCPHCGTAEKNEPLTGVLQVIYDYDSIKNEISKEKFLNFIPGQIKFYPQLLPLKKSLNEKQLEGIKFPQSPLINVSIENISVQIFDDTKNPTLSYKDRASLLTVLKAQELGIDDIAAASTGNAASSLAGICAAQRLTSRVFVPKNIPHSKLLQIQTYGSKVYLVDGDYDEAFDLCLDVASKRKWYNRNTAYNPITIEGKKTAAYDLFIASSGKLPEHIFVPVGDGVIISGIYKGLRDLKQLGWIDEFPKLIALQAEGSDALVRYIDSGEFTYKTASTIADSISAGAPRNLYMAAAAVKNTNGIAIRISDEEISKAQSLIARNTGILVEPSCAISYAGLQKMLSEGLIDSPERCLLMFTGNGLKDPDALKQNNIKLEPKTPQAWQEELLNE
jgi:threonine synthase